MLHLVAGVLSVGSTFTPSKLGVGLRAFADNASVTVVNCSGNVLTAVASTLLNAKVARLEGASLTSKQVHAFCDHVELLIRARVLCADLHVVDGPAIHHGDRPAIHDLQSHGTRTSPRLEGGLGGLPHP